MKSSISIFRETVYTSCLNVFLKLSENISKRFDSVLKRVRIVRVYFKFKEYFKIVRECSLAILLTLINARGQQK